MLLTLSILLLTLSIFDKPVDKLLGRIKCLSWKDAIRDSWNNILRFSSQAGREATNIALIFFYVMKDGNLTLVEKVLLYAGIIYLLVPKDILPRKVFGLLGLFDDAFVVSWIYGKIKENITPEIRQKSEETLAKLFSPKVYISPTMVV